MILSTKGELAKRALENDFGKGFPPNIAIRTRYPIEFLNEAGRLDDLISPPGNRLEALKSDRAGQHSLRINANGGLFSSNHFGSGECRDRGLSSIEAWVFAKTISMPVIFCGVCISNLWA